MMDQESRDANSLLVEFDRGLQSLNVGDQCEAVVRFTQLFQRHPLPVLIDSACLKLSEAFRQGSNFIRIQISEVFERNQNHLNKIYNVDLFYRNIFTVTTSNDPIARSITLLTLANIASVVSDHKSIHHYISSSLDATNEQEFIATIICAASYVKKSSEFARNIYPRIVSIIDSDTTSVELKLRALDVFDHAFYTAQDAAIVREFLMKVMTGTNLTRLTATCLTLSTKIAFTSVTDILSQISVLTNCFKEDDRQNIKLTALNNLIFLADKSPHVWESSSVEPLIEHLDKKMKPDKRADDQVDTFTCMVLAILSKLLSCKCNFVSTDQRSHIYEIASRLALDSNNIELCAMAFELLTVIHEEQLELLEDDGELSPDLSKQVKEILSAIKTFLTNSSTFVKASRPKSNIQKPYRTSANIASYATKSIYKHIVRLCQLNPQYCSEVSKLILSRLSSKDLSLMDLCPYFTELACAIMDKTQDPTINPEACWKIISSRAVDSSETNLLNLCVLYLQALRLMPNHNVADSFVDKVIKDRSDWFGFKLLRQSLRYGHYSIAERISEELHQHVTTDTTEFYYKSLKRISEAENLITTSKSDATLNETLQLYESAMSPLRASISTSRTNNFQLQFVWLRIKTLQTHSTLIQCCRIYELAPITYTGLLSAIGAHRTTDLNQTKSSFVQQMPKIARDFRYLAESYDELSTVSFDCDEKTLTYVQLLKSCNIIMADVIDCIFQYGRNLPVISKLPPRTCDVALEHKDLEKTCETLINRMQDEILKPGILPSANTIGPLVDLIRSFSASVIRCPFVFPRYFFQPLQSTQIKLAITPQPSGSSGTISLLINQNLVLKVEGLIQNLSKSLIVIRNIAKILISIALTPVKQTLNGDMNYFVQSIAIPDNNYFKAEFLIPLKYVGSFNVAIEISIIDEQERIWKTGPTEKLSLAIS